MGEPYEVQRGIRKRQMGDLRGRVHFALYPRGVRGALQKRRNYALRLRIRQPLYQRQARRRRVFPAFKQLLPLQPEPPLREERRRRARQPHLSRQIRHQRLPRRRQKRALRPPRPRLVRPRRYAEAGGRMDKAIRCREGGVARRLRRRQRARLGRKRRLGAVSAAQLQSLLLRDTGRRLLYPRRLRAGMRLHGLEAGQADRRAGYRLLLLRLPARQDNKKYHP